MAWTALCSGSSAFSRLLSVSQLAIALVNLFATRLATPHPLPRMDFSKGIPPESSTLVVVPTMLTSAENIGQLVDALEVRFLANRDENLRFGLLTDFPDAPEEKLAEDEPLLLLARQGIEALNEKYGGKEDTFFLFHRPRQWNPQERIWMGYERKRGKLAELNLLLRGGSGSGFSLIVGNTEVLSKVKYVITLDTDTELPRDSAWQLVGAMAHPLNRPLYDADRGRIVSGYGILQPRVAVSLPGTNRSRYARMWGSDAGIDPYTRVVSDVYQDLFGEGSFIGKGIYDVDAFEQVLKDRFPENLILSHDLIEGCYVRSGLISDVQFYEAYPSRYSADVSRRRRWIRGDWQILRWLFPRVPGPDACFRKNPISALSRWKIFDNLRRSLAPLALTPPSPARLDRTVVSLVLYRVGHRYRADSFLDYLPHGLPQKARRRTDEPTPRRRGPLHRQMPCPGRYLRSSVCLMRHFPAALPFCTPCGSCWFQAGVFSNGTRRVKSIARSRTDLAGSCRSMWIAPVIAVAGAGYLVIARPVALPVALPILSLWFASPLIAWWISMPLSPRRAQLAEDQIVFLRKLSRRTWAFFETFVGPDDHWLPPDNYQEEPLAVVAHRTSPTNMGLVAPLGSVGL